MTRLYLKNKSMIQFAALRQYRRVPDPFTYIPVRFPTRWLLSATAADARLPHERRPRNQDEWKTVASSDSAGFPNEKITNVP